MKNIIGLKEVVFYRLTWFVIGPAVGPRLALTNLRRKKCFRSSGSLSLWFFCIFQGFCGWSLVVYDRLLIPSNPANGVLRYKDNYFAFCDKQAAYEFSNAPDRYVNHLFACFFASLFN